MATFLFHKAPTALVQQKKSLELAIGYSTKTGELLVAEWRGKYVVSKKGNKEENELDKSKDYSRKGKEGKGDSMPSKSSSPFSQSNQFQNDLSLSSESSSSSSSPTLPIVNHHLSKVPFSSESLPHGGMILRHDIVPCWLAICAKEFQSQFHDVYEFRTLPEFFTAVLESPVGNKLFIKVVEGSYCRNITSFEDTISISHDIMRRWVYPLVPDGQSTRNVAPLFLFRAMEGAPLYHHTMPPFASLSSSPSSFKLTSPDPFSLHDRSSSFFSSPSPTPPSAANTSGGPSPLISSNSFSIASSPSKAALDTIPFRSSIRSSLNAMVQMGYARTGSIAKIVRHFDKSLGEYIATSHSTYKSLQDVDIDRTATIGQCCLIGSKTRIGKNAKIEETTIGSGCSIGDNVHLTRCVVWNNVHIDNDVEAEDTIICAYCRIQRNSVLKKGTVISFLNNISSNETLPENSRIASPQQALQSDRKDPSRQLSSSSSSASSSQLQRANLGKQSPNSLSLLASHKRGGSLLTYLPTNFPVIKEMNLSQSAHLHPPHPQSTLSTSPPSLSPLAASAISFATTPKKGSFAEDAIGSMQSLEGAGSGSSDFSDEEAESLIDTESSSLSHLSPSSKEETDIDSDDSFASTSSSSFGSSSSDESSKDSESEWSSDDSDGESTLSDDRMSASESDGTSTRSVMKRIIAMYPGSLKSTDKAAAIVKDIISFIRSQNESTFTCPFALLCGIWGKATHIMRKNNGDKENAVAFIKKEVGLYSQYIKQYIRADDELDIVFKLATRTDTHSKMLPLLSDVLAECVDARLLSPKVVFEWEKLLNEEIEYSQKDLDQKLKKGKSSSNVKDAEKDEDDSGLESDEESDDEEIEDLKESIEFGKRQLDAMRPLIHKLKVAPKPKAIPKPKKVIPKKKAEESSDSSDWDD
eukprot:MONOS_11627.1-p1 / transcript=MONOS_11627.1 / gene=MONOS_11627 / organism=Monocercomonoides_exilis_PA203 / gene_product=Translation initiation factor eIF-2B subunit epsilon like protein / transcript_product=Translation initiation factor eIF-2B subunit epsilon like protein / location=Mono_scaffold00594:28206-31099(-) / protein_length=922 / sequence_SO=supercontig / SO=protein_coding / is_pseudo=false